MGKYLKLFNNHSLYNEYLISENFIKPNVSHCIQEQHVHYNPSFTISATFMDDINPNDPEQSEPWSQNIFNGEYLIPQKKANELFDRIVIDGNVYEYDDLDVKQFNVDLYHSDSPHNITYYVKSDIVKPGILTLSPYETVTIGEGIITLGSDCLMYCGIRTLHLPDSLTTIERWAVMGDVVTMNIPKNVTSIAQRGLDFFGEQGALQSLYIYCDVPPTIVSDSITRVPSTAVFYVKPELVETYKTANIWSNFASQIQPMP